LRNNANLQALLESTSKIYKTENNRKFAAVLQDITKARSTCHDISANGSRNCYSAHRHLLTPLKQTQDNAVMLLGRIVMSLSNGHGPNGNKPIVCIGPNFCQICFYCRRALAWFAAGALMVCFCFAFVVTQIEWGLTVGNIRYGTIR
jgi:hypothetical protein